MMPHTPQNLAFPPRSGRPRCAAPRRRHHGGFTLVELLVAIAVFMIFMAALATVFFTSRELYAMGTASAQVTNYATAIEANIRRDLRNVSRDGFMVIRMENRTVTLPGGVRRTYAADQLYFFANGRYASQRYAPTYNYAGRDLPLGLGTVARIWYGHLDTPAWRDTINPPEPYRWSLGRQAMVMANVPTDINHARVRGGRTPGTNAVEAPDYWYSLDQSTIPWSRDMRTDPSGVLYDSRDVCFQTMLQVRQTVQLDGTINATPRARPVHEQPDVMRNMVRRLKADLTIRRPLDPEELVKAHALLAPNCDSFRVEFAGDYDGDGWIDLDGRPGHEDEILWYGLAWDPNSSGNSSIFTVPGEASVGRRRSGGGQTSPPNQGTNPVDVNLIVRGRAAQTWTAVFGYDHVATPWPMMLRITVNLHDENGRYHDRYRRVVKSDASAADHRGDDRPDGRTFSFIVNVGP